MLPGRPDWLPLLLFPLSPGPPRLDLPVAILLLVGPVLRSVRRLLSPPPHPLSVPPHRGAALLLVTMRDALFALLYLYPPSVALGHLSCAPLAPSVARLRVGRKNLLLCGGLLGLPLVGGGLPLPPVVRGRRPMPFSVELLPLLLQQPPAIETLVVVVPTLLLLLVLLLGLVGAQLLLLLLLQPAEVETLVVLVPPLLLLLLLLMVVVMVGARLLLLLLQQLPDIETLVVLVPLLLLQQVLLL